MLAGIDFQGSLDARGQVLLSIRFLTSKPPEAKQKVLLWSFGLAGCFCWAFCSAALVASPKVARKLEPYKVLRA